MKLPKTLLIALCCTVLIGCKGKVDYTEYFTGYDDRISYIVEGYQMHWDGFSPENLELSYIYKYESPSGAFVKYDLDGDGTEDLLMGDQFENGDYQIYDIFTFDKTTGDIIHLFCGGERDWCIVNRDGVIVETGSNSADDSFTKYYVLKKLKLKKVKPVTPDPLALKMDKFINYTGIVSPEMKVIVDDEGYVGRYLDENDTSYHGVIQDEYWIEKEKAHIETVKACDGRGFLSLKVPGKEFVYSSYETNADVIGTMIYEDGYVPEVYNCLGYVKGRFMADIDGKVGFIREELVNWDAVNSF